MPLSPSLARIATAHPPLPAEEMKRLVARAQAGDIAARDRIVATHLRFVFLHAARYARRARQLEADDLVSEGVFGLLRAIEKYDESVETAFITYAAQWVCSFMGRAVSTTQSAFGGSSHARELVASGRLGRLRAEARERGMTEEQATRSIGRRMRMRSESVVAMATLIRSPKSLDADLPGFDEVTLHDVLAGPSRSPEDAVAERQERAVLRDRLDAIRASLRPREQVIFDRRLVAPEDEVETMSEVGARLGISRGRVQQLEAEMRKRLAKALREFKGMEGERR